MSIQNFSRIQTCVDLLSFLFGLNGLESKLYFHLLQKGRKSVTQLITDISRTQSTIHTGLKTLVSHNLVTKEKQGKSPKGYEFIYTAISPVYVQEMLESRLDQLCFTAKRCIKTFKDESLTCELV